MFYEAEEAEKLAIEVIITCTSGDECVYWVKLEDLPENDREDTAIELATQFHTSLGLLPIDEDNTCAYEPFSRCEDEFRWVEIPTP
jgi:hypothetical protein